MIKSQGQDSASPLKTLKNIWNNDFLDTGQQATEDSHPQERRNSGDESCTFLGFLPADFQTLVWEGSAQEESENPPKMRGQLCSLGRPRWLEVTNRGLERKQGHRGWLRDICRGTSWVHLPLRTYRLTFFWSFGYLYTVSPRYWVLTISFPIYNAVWQIAGVK